MPERTHAERMASRDGYFPPESLIRRLGNSPVVPFLGGGPAVLLQVAHPLVAAGVTQHSDYRDDLWRRLLRTLRAVYLMAYGTKQEAEWAGEAVQRVHARVHGTLAEAVGQFPAGTPYRADDPALMLWVHATLVHSSLAVFTRFVVRLGASRLGACRLGACWLGAGRGEDALGRADQAVGLVSRCREALDELVDPVLQPLGRVRARLRPLALARALVATAGRTRGPRRLRGPRGACGPGLVVVPAGRVVLGVVG